MSTISSQLLRIKQEKEELKTALESKGIEISDDCKLGELGEHIEIIPSNKMYVCTAVNKVTRTWEGQEAILMGDASYRYYIFSDKVTTGLKYTSVNPAPGEGWNENCCMRMNAIFQGISTNGLMLYGCWGNGGMPGIQYGHAAMDVNISSGICNSGIEVQGVIVAEYKNVTAISQTKTGITGNQPLTIATWYQDLGGTANTLILGLGSKSSNKGLFLCSHNGYAAYNLGGTTVSTGVLVNDKLHHICLVYTGSAIGVYIDGELAYQAAASISLTDSPFFFGGNMSGTAGSISGFANMHAYIKHSYVYTRVLSDFDVRALANEEWPKIWLNYKIIFDCDTDCSCEDHPCGGALYTTGHFEYLPDPDTTNSWIYTNMQGATKRITLSDDWSSFITFQPPSYGEPFPATADSVMQVMSGGYRYLNAFVHAELI